MAKESLVLLLILWLSFVQNRIVFIFLFKSNAKFYFYVISNLECINSGILPRLARWRLY